MRSVSLPTNRSANLDHIIELTVVVPTFNERKNINALIAGVDAALGGISWQIIVVDDDSKDGTAEAVKAIAQDDPRIQCLRRVGRRGLSGAVLEGFLASAAPYVAVIDADLQHDETLLPKMLDIMRTGDADLVIASRYLDSKPANSGFSRLRFRASRLAVQMAQHVLKAKVSDPVSGFFTVRRGVIDALASRLSPSGFKILFDIISTSGGTLKIRELPYAFSPRQAGESKLDGRVVLDYLGLLFSKLTRDLVSPRALLFAMVGASGLIVHLSVLKLALTLGFARAQVLAALTAMTSNYLINNALTYRDRQKHGWRMLGGYIRFCILCGVGLFANVATAILVRQHSGAWWLAGAMGAAVGAAWNYLTTAVAVW